MNNKQIVMDEAKSKHILNLLLLKKDAWFFMIN